MKDQEIQKEQLKTTLNPEQALELAVSIQLGIKSQLATHARQPLDERNQSGKSQAHASGVLADHQQHREVWVGNGRGINNNNRASTHNCRNCGQPWDSNHRARCQAIG